MGSYAVDHADALADVAEAGASVSFSRTTGQTVSDSTDVATGGTTVTVAASAIELEGDAQTYRDLSLVQRNPVTLFVIPSTYGDDVQPGDAFTWGSVDRTVKLVRTLSPDGTNIGMTVVGAQ